MRQAPPDEPAGGGNLRDGSTSFRSLLRQNPCGSLCGSRRHMRGVFVVARGVSRALSCCLTPTYVSSSDHLPRTENPRVGGSIPSLATT